LPKLTNPPVTILDYLCERFPQVGRNVWTARIAKGKVRGDDEIPVTLISPYKHGITLFYFRELQTETAIPFQEEIIFQNDHLLVADKPHFLPVVPAGQSVNECLLYRVQRSTGIAELAPLHRLDRETAGLVLFSKIKSARSSFARLFASGEIERKYLAIARLPETTAAFSGQQWLVEDRLEAASPWFRMKIVPGVAN
jgi:tRNA pseudouridine32 synthase/23S rRNA pseudouridine746 synthase